MQVALKIENGELSFHGTASNKKTISLSSTEAEYMRLAQAAKEAMWLYMILTRLGRAIVPYA
jgi:hypothetical protein